MASSKLAPYKSCSVPGASMYCSNGQVGAERLRGLVMTDKGEEVFLSLPHPIVSNGVPHGMTDDVVETCRVFASREGTIVNVFFFGGKWHVASNKKFTNKRSRFASPDGSFGKTFARALEGLWKNACYHLDDDDLVSDFCRLHLDESKGYIFMTSLEDHERLVCRTPSKPKMWLLATYCKGSFEYNPELILNCGTFMPVPLEHSVQTVCGLERLLDSLDPMDYTGLVIVTREDKHLKALCPDYARMMDLRGENHCIVHRLIDLMESSDEQAKNLCELHPSLKATYGHIKEHKDRIIDLYAGYASDNVCPETSWPAQKWMDKGVCEMVLSNPEMSKFNMLLMFGIMSRQQLVKMYVSHMHLSGNGDWKKLHYSKPPMPADGRICI